jgi:hypothetical protein
VQLGLEQRRCCVVGGNVAKELEGIICWCA